VDSNCEGCGAVMAEATLSCLQCGWLAHSDELKRLAADADAAESAGDLSAALSSWRRALDLLPPETRQHAAILDKIRGLSGRVDRGETPKPKGALAGGTAGLGALALLLWKFKFILALVLTKGKLLLLGLTKAPTFLSMFAFFGVYWSIFGWQFALGFVLAIYVHEMGHVYQLSRFGISATAPMFIPFVGAFVRLNQYPATAREDSRVGLAGPIWGLGAAAAAWLLYLATGAGMLGAIAKMAAFINIFNLIPVWQLDGARGFRSMNRTQRGLALAASGGAWFLTSQVYLLIVALVGIFRLFERDQPREPDHVALVQWIVLIAGLGALCTIHVPLPR